MSKNHEKLHAHFKFRLVLAPIFLQSFQMLFFVDLGTSIHEFNSSTNRLLTFAGKFVLFGAARQAESHERVNTKVLSHF